MKKQIAVIDGNSLMHRAFHAIPPTMIADNGLHTNAVFGFLSMLFKMIEVLKPDAIVCAFDRGRPEFRMKALEQYKAQRKPMDEHLREQFPIIEEVLESLDIPVVFKKGWEGDDVLATIAARNEALGYETLLVSGDRDILQLTNEKTKVVATKKGISEIAIMGPKEVEEKYGVRPDQIPDYLGIKGDSSDNIPGVAGIGEKGAAKLLQEFGSLDAVYENLDKIKGKQKEKLEDCKDAAYISKEVATIVRDLDLDQDVSLQEISFPSFNAKNMQEIFKKYKLYSAMKKFLSLKDQEHVESDVEFRNDHILKSSRAREYLEKKIATWTKDKNYIGLY
ncbi:MAG: hypothetical protein HUJ63_05100, partial [Enterococcus sp.]|nr:hypothetical protein [Enterococcus sp.]